MFARSIIICGSLLLASLVAVAGCEGENSSLDYRENPQPLGAVTPTPSCDDDLPSSWAVTPAESTVLPGTKVHVQITRNGSLFTPAPGAPTTSFDAPNGGTITDDLGSETDFVAGTTVGDYVVRAFIKGADGAMVCPPFLTAVVHVVPALAADAGASAPALVPANATHIDLAGPWALVGDANTADDPSPVLTLGGASTESVSLGYAGKDGESCGCNAEHKVIKLPKSFACASTTLAFDYGSGGSFGATSNEAVSIRFCNGGDCSEDSFYGGDQFKGSEQAGHSNCGWEWSNTLPAPQITDGHNVIDLSKLQKETNGSCSGSFDTIDIHLEAYACFAKTDLGSQTLSNVVLY